MKTDFNQPCQGVYADARFEREGEAWVLTRAAQREIEIKPWLTIEGVPLPMVVTTT